MEVNLMEETLKWTFPNLREAMGEEAEEVVEAIVEEEVALEEAVLVGVIDEVVLEIEVALEEGVVEVLEEGLEGEEVDIDECLWLYSTTLRINN